ncbi:hypothetical protein CLOM_g5228 [Closterium sp. NIES-68]|nr:hypothetical protein CLOM_g5228 [Closterium sp. NIES-68]GJP83845.1 hypothetical protein CLOP_g13947 [Closterium sp. NIES-67]
MPTIERSSLVDGLLRPVKVVPTSYLYDARGSALYDAITRLRQYYPFLEERRLLKKHAKEIARLVPRDAVVVELGCGNALKTRVLLQAIAAHHGRCRFAGIDVSEAFLLEARRNILAAVPRMAAGDVELVQAEYLDGLRAVRRQHPDATLCVLWLGSSVGNLTDDDIVQFFTTLHRIGGANMQLLLCTDLWKDRDVLHGAYKDDQGVTEDFIKNGARNAFQSLGVRAADVDEAAWKYDVVVNSDLRRVEMWLEFPHSFSFPRTPVSIGAGERVLMEISRKFTPQDIAALASKSAMLMHAAWRSPLYGMQLLLPQTHALLESWRDADTFFQSVPDWSAKPIDFRHPFCFYYGHLPSFAILKLLPARTPSSLDVMFSRGIDPLLLDPSKCHSHPAVPPAWPSRAEIEAYARDVRREILDAMQQEEEGGRCAVTARQVALAVEHDRMHIETLSYMQLQADKQAFLDSPHPDSPPASDADLPSPSSIATEPSSLHPNSPFILDSPHPSAAHKLNSAALRESLAGDLDVLIPAGPVAMGTDVSGEKDGFVWDNEGPATVSLVPRDFVVSSKPVSVAQFHSFVTEVKGYKRAELWEEADWAFLRKHGLTCPASWSFVKRTRGVSEEEDGVPVMLSDEEGEGSGSENSVMDGEEVADMAGKRRSGQKAVGGEEEGEYWVHTHLGLGEGTEAKPWYEVADAPVWVSLAEAQAFCMAAGSEYRVMSEAEWNQIVSQPPPFSLPADTMEFDDDGEEKAEETKGLKAGMKQKGTNASVFIGTDLDLASGEEGVMTGNRLAELQRSVQEGGWEWTSSPFEPFPGFVKMEEYPEYSTDFFDGCHFVLKGSSPVTHPCMVRDSFRNYYQRQYPFVFAKFRCCKDLARNVV